MKTLKAIFLPILWFVPLTLLLTSCSSDKEINTGSVKIANFLSNGIDTVDSAGTIRHYYVLSYSMPRIAFDTTKCFDLHLTRNQFAEYEFFSAKPVPCTGTNLETSK